MEVELVAAVGAFHFVVKHKPRHLFHEVHESLQMFTGEFVEPSKKLFLGEVGMHLVAFVDSLDAVCIHVEIIVFGYVFLALQRSNGGIFRILQFNADIVRQIDKLSVFGFAFNPVVGQVDGQVDPRAAFVLFLVLAL